MRAETKGTLAFLLVTLCASTHALHHAPMPLLRAPQRGAVEALRGGGGNAARALIQELKVPAKVVDWTVNDVVEWLKASGLGETAAAARQNQIDGSILMDLTEDRIARMGLDSLAKEMRMMGAVQQLQANEKMPHRRQIQVPGLLSSFYRFFTCKFLMLSEGKSGAECRNELVTANTNMALVSTLLLGVTMSWTFGATNLCYCDKGTKKNCFCTAGYDLDGEALWAFFSSSTIASALFTACTVTAVVQILAVQECSDDHEVTVFFDKLGKDGVLCGPLMIAGLFFTSVSVAVYLVFNERLGVIGNKNKWAYGTFASVLAIAVFIVPKWASTSRKLYASKLYAAWHPEKKGYTSGVENN